MSLPTQAVHNDVHDYNILVSTDISEPKRVTGLVDMGDMCIAPRICDLAITAAYVVLECSDPEVALSTLVAGYHSVNPLQPAEIDAIWALLQMRLAVSVVNSTVMAERHPEDPYVVITQAPAWRFLETQTIDANRLKARLRAACGLPICDRCDYHRSVFRQSSRSIQPTDRCRPSAATHGVVVGGSRSLATKPSRYAAIRGCPHWRRILSHERHLARLLC